ncbi:Retrovirus-related Pol polyprotein from transposon TNT 1-94 [Bienertia sinuspersici]
MPSHTLPSPKPPPKSPSPEFHRSAVQKIINGRTTGNIVQYHGRIYYEEENNSNDDEDVEQQLEQEVLPYGEDDSSDDEVHIARQRAKGFTDNLVETDFTLFKWKVGQRFPTRELFREAVAKFAVFQGRNLSIVVSNHNRQQWLGVKCTKGCPFKLYASWDSRRATFVVKSLTEEHTCSRNMERNKQMKSTWLADQLLEVFKTRTHWLDKEIIETVRLAYKVVIKKDFAYKVKYYAHKKLHASMKEHYYKVWRIQQKLDIEKDEAARCVVLLSTNSLFQVNHYLDSFIVDLEAKSCSYPPPIKVGPGHPRKKRRKDPHEDPKKKGLEKEAGEVVEERMEAQEWVEETMAVNKEGTEKGRRVRALKGGDVVSIKGVEDRFSRANGARKYSLNKLTYETKQQGRIVSEYNTEMKVLWEELESLLVMPALLDMNNEVMAYVNALRDGELQSGEVSSKEWKLDSGATHHMTCNRESMCEVVEMKDAPRISLPTEQTSGMRAIGKLILKNGIELKNVMLIPSFKQNLLSIQKLSKDSNCKVIFWDQYYLIQDKTSSEIRGVGRERRGLYYLVNEPVNSMVKRIKEDVCEKVKAYKAMNVEAEMTMPSRVKGKKKMSNATLWHMRLGHALMRRILKIDLLR